MSTQRPLLACTSQTRHHDLDPPLSGGYEAGVLRIKIVMRRGGGRRRSRWVDQRGYRWLLCSSVSERGSPPPHPFGWLLCTRSGTRRRGPCGGLGGGGRVHTPGRSGSRGRRASRGGKSRRCKAR